MLQRFFRGCVGKYYVFVDVGAARPDFLSISALYRTKGWRVICVEPNPEFAALHRARSHEIYEYACGVNDQDGVEFKVADSAGQAYEGGTLSYESFSSLALKPGFAELLPSSVRLHTIRVNMRRLDTVLREASVEHIDVLSIDVEGWELEVLQGVDLARVGFPVIVLENFLRDPSYRATLARSGYELWKELPPNQVYVRSQRLSCIDRIGRLLNRRGRLPIRA